MHLYILSELTYVHTQLLPISDMAEFINIDTRNRSQSDYWYNFSFIDLVIPEDHKRYFEIFHNQLGIKVTEGNCKAVVHVGADLQC